MPTELRSRMKVVEARSFSIEGLGIVERPVPQAGRGEILLKMKAATLNYRDLAVLTENYFPNLPLPYVPLSDGCGEVIQVGEGVERFRPGDRVLPLYTQGWHDGRPTPEQRAKRTLGAPLPGVLQEYMLVPAEDAVAAPAHLTDVEAATLPVAALTAWSVLLEGRVKPGDVIVVQGTGGVALFGVQFAKMMGATVIVLSSSDDKLQRVKALGADAGINYHSHPDWHRPVREMTQGRGADLIIETAGATLSESLSALAFGGFIGLVGFVAGYEATVPIRQLVGPLNRIQGMTTGSRTGFEAMNRAISSHRLHPVVDRIFDISDISEAFDFMKSGKHFGKIGIQF